MKVADGCDAALLDQSLLAHPDKGQEEEEEPKASTRAITLNFITGGLGSAIFSLPWSVAGSSIIPSLFIIAVVLLINAWTIALIVRAGEKYQVFDLGSVVAKLGPGLGPPMQFATNVFVWASMFLCLVSYVIVMHDSAQKLLEGSFFDNRVLLVTLSSIFVLPLCFLSQRLLERTSSLAIAVNVYLFTLLFALYGKALSHGDLPDDCCLLGSTMRGDFALVAVMFQAVIVQMCVLPMYKALEDRSPEKFDRIIAVGFSTLFLLFAGFSCVGYLLVGPNVQSNVLLDLPRGIFATIGQVGTMLVVACVYPIMVYPMIAPIQEGLGDFLPGARQSTAVACAKVAIVAAAGATAARFGSLGVVNVVNGAMQGVVFVALLPSVIGLLLLSTGRLQKVGLILLLVCGVAVSGLGLIFNENYVGDLNCSLQA